MADINISKKISVNFIKSKMPLIQNEIKDLIINRFLKIISLQEKELYQLRFDSKYFKELAQKTLKQLISNDKEKEPEKKNSLRMNNSINSIKQKPKITNKKNIQKPQKKVKNNSPGITSNDIIQCNSVCFLQKNKKLNTANKEKDKDKDLITIRTKRTSNKLNSTLNNSNNNNTYIINYNNEKNLFPSLSTTDTNEYNDIKIHQKKIVNMKMAPSNSQTVLPIVNKNLNKNKEFNHLTTESSILPSTNIFINDRVKTSHSIKNFRELFEHSSFLQDEKKELQNKNIKRGKNLSQASFSCLPGINNNKGDFSYCNINTLQNSIISPQVTRTQKILKSLSNSARKGIRINTLDNAKLNSFLGKL